MASKEFKTALDARVAFLGSCVERGTMDPKFALSTMMKETLTACINELNKNYHNSGDEWDTALRAAMRDIDITVNEESK